MRDDLGPHIRWASLVAVLMASVPAAAQCPDRFTNLKVFPKDVSRAELEPAMRRFAFALGVRCDHCHVQSADKTLDFAKDDKEAKRTARVMLQMVAAINRDYLDRLDKSSPIAVECVTCHRGLTQPRTLNSILAESIQKEGLDAAIAQYRDLRGKYYGSGQYDFGETTLNQLAESLLAGGRPKEAVAIMEMNFASNHPDSLWAYHMLASAHEVTGEVNKAIADYHKVLELHPDDTWARKQIEALAPAKK